ncbi:MAG TPA: hypothetical protein VFL85_02405 [Candidatus Saccharimonadales bacterium]|nr:hypothetical protein [Candidatus Saccharimonadales bacterium]
MFALNILHMAFAVGLTSAILCLSEYIWRHREVHVEIARKFVHVTIGTFVAFWPLFLTWNEIRVLSVAFIVVVALSSYFNIFRAIHAVERPTFGEYLFAASVGLVTIITQDPAIYAAAILQMSLADGMAAIVGTIYGKSNFYTVMGQRKSVIGTLAFLAVSLVILASYVAINGLAVPGLYLVLLAIAAAVIENVSVRGLDNLLVPIIVAVTLTSLR